MWLRVKYERKSLDRPIKMLRKRTLDLYVITVIRSLNDFSFRQKEILLSFTPYGKLNTNFLGIKEDGIKEDGMFCLNFRL